eukprot:10814466-Lingulodinium_polyedra.AAC.1
MTPSANGPAGIGTGQTPARQSSPRPAQRGPAQQSSLRRWFSPTNRSAPAEVAGASGGAVPRQRPPPGRPGKGLRLRR